MYAECHFDGSHYPVSLLGVVVFSVFMQSGLMLSVDMLIDFILSIVMRFVVIMLIVIILSAVGITVVLQILR